MVSGRRRHTPEQIIRKLAEADRMAAEDIDNAGDRASAWNRGANLVRWRNQYGGMKAQDAKLLKELQRENAMLKRLLADAELERIV